MKYALISLLFFVCSLSAETSPTTQSLQVGKLSSVHLLATARITGKQSPDGLRFLFLVKRAPQAEGQFTLKETRDFLLGGQSYAEKTQAELGQVFEPGTMVDTAEGFFAKQPGLRRYAPANIEGANIMAIAIGGTKLASGEKADIPVHVGYDKDFETFTFRVTVPPAPETRTKK